ncbi:MAG: GNAT family N-acetyltransferase [bacterium]
MQIIELRDKERIAEYLRRNLYLNIYQLGDLDDYYWPDTQWWALQEGTTINALVLLYTGLSVPTLLALVDQDHMPCVELLSHLLPKLPEELYVHYSEGLAEVLSQRYELRLYGDCLKMGLQDSEPVLRYDTSAIGQLSEADERELLDFYKVASPGNWFNRRMLATGRYYGIRRDGRLASVAGVHVVSGEYVVAALGNIATHPDWRGQGLAKQTTAKVCQMLLSDGCRIGLNVMADNIAAVKCYSALGFKEAGRYYEAHASAIDR